MNKVAFNERLKLRATYLNNLAVALLATGIIGPILAVIYGTGAKSTDPALVGTGAGICLLLSIALHLGAQAILGGLQE